MRAPIAQQQALRAVLDRTALDWGLEPDWRQSRDPEVVVLRASVRPAQPAVPALPETAFAGD